MTSQQLSESLNIYMHQLNHDPTESKKQEIRTKIESTGKGERSFVQKPS